jgi:diguanylate cyclase (GGDEF)-like protein
VSEFVPVAITPVEPGLKWQQSTHGYISLWIDAESLDHLRREKTTMVKGVEDEPVDPRIYAYSCAIRSIQQGHFDIDVPLGPPDPLGLLGVELQKLAQFLSRQFDLDCKLQVVTDSVIGGLLLDDVLDRIFDAFHAVIPYNRLGCAFVGEDQRHAAAYWSRADYPEIKLRQGFTAELAGSSLRHIMAVGEPRILNDLDEYLANHLGSASTRLMLAEGIRSSLTCPLIAQGKPVGFLFFSSVEKNTYQGIHQGIFLRIASQLSMMIEKSRLYQKIVEINEALTLAQRELQELVARDPLTGIYNRRGILELLQAQFSHGQREQGSLAVAMVDVDFFKKLNDSHGHAVGDAVLMEVAARLSRSLRGYNHIGRIGGEEFLIVLSATDFDNAAAIAERLRCVVGNRPMAINGLSLSTTISIGVAHTTCLPSVTDAEQLIRIADEALYEAKHAGRNRVVCHRVDPSARP